VVRRLEVMMWTDWHADVWSAAAQALARTGHSPAIHDLLLERMSSDAMPSADLNSSVCGLFA